MALIPILRRVLAAGLSLALAACGTGRDDPLVSTGQGLAAFLGRGATATEAPAFTAATVPPELVARLPGPLMLVEVPGREASTGMTRVGRNGDIDTWRGPNGIGLTLDETGVLRSTRGLGFDLMASGAGPTSAAVAARRAGPVQREMVHLDGEARPVRRVYACEITRDGADTVTIAGRATPLVRMTERCTGADGYGFENAYWIDRGGRAIHSRQWISAEIGSFRITILRD
ncbi:hypothetical protein HKCCSP123_10770 [Rhodobacterales bacterium HKCCSP123]|nr:hypothetical protein [Rhodobacterales bacterium HKCCSP123]